MAKYIYLCNNNGSKFCKNKYNLTPNSTTRKYRLAWSQIGNFAQYIIYTCSTPSIHPPSVSPILPTNLPILEKKRGIKSGVFRLQQNQTPRQTSLVSCAEATSAYPPWSTSSLVWKPGQQEDSNKWEHLDIQKKKEIGGRDQINNEKQKQKNRQQSVSSERYK